MEKLGKREDKKCEDWHGDDQAANELPNVANDTWAYLKVI